MATRQPRLNVVLERPLYRSIERLATREGVSLSLKARDLLREAMELHEDAYWVQQAHAREATFDRKNALILEEVRLRAKRRGT